MLNGTDALEVVSFNNGLFLEIYQSGCDSLRQEFRFHLFEAPGEDTAAAWFSEARQQFRFLSSLGPQYAPFSEWADALDLGETDMRLAQPVEIQTGFWAKIDRIDSFDGPTLIVILANYQL